MRTIALFLFAISAFSADLPRALIIGDSIYQQPAGAAAAMLQGRVDVVWPALEPGEVRNSGRVLADLDHLLGDGVGDLIYLNVGLGDLIYRAPKMRAFRVLPPEAGGVRTTSPEQYEANLQALIPRLKATGAKIVWANTTPIRHSATKVFQMGSEIEYNGLAAKVMAEHQVPIHDMYGYVHTLIDMDKPAGHGVDPFFFDRKPLHPPIVRRILSELDLIRPVNGPVKLVVMLGGWSHIGGGIVFDANKPRAGQPKGTLDHLVLNNADYAHLLRPDGRWATRPDVWIHFDHRGPKSGVLGIGYGGDRKRGIGSELSLGHVLGDHFDEQVCIIKTTLGTPSLATDLRPPSSGETGKAYTTLITQIQDSLAHLRDKFPDYTDDAGYEFAGLVINLGEQDDKPELYAEYLPLLIKDLRKELKTPDLPVAIVGTGLGGREAPEHPAILAAQQAMAGASVAFVETRDFWPAEDARTPSRHAPHAQWYCNAESFYKVGEAIGREMLKLLK